VLTPLPRGPFLELGGFSKGSETVLPTSLIQRTTFSLPGHTFEFLEKPEYYFDAFHLNAKGRQKFTETLVSELMGRLRAADSKSQDNSGAQLPVNGLRN
jgi:lysophospholipase L1-like esterase